MTKKLNKAMLEEMGIKVELNPKTDEWIVSRYAKRYGKSKESTWRVVKRRDIIRKHKYAPDTIYPGYAWSYKNKPFIVTESRLVYAYFIGEIPEDYDVDHIDNDKFNNRLYNLKLLTRDDYISERQD